MGVVRRWGLGGWRQGGVACVLLLVLGSCRAIAGLHDVTYAVGDAACGTAALPSTGNGQVRLVNAGTQGASTDFCIRISGTSGWGNPVLSAGPASCDAGLPYAKATVPFAVQQGLIDVQAIPTGSGCDAAPTSQVMGVAVGDSTAGAPVMTLVRYGGGSTAETIAALPEEPAAQSSITTSKSYGLRFVNALSSGESINVGYAAAASLPTTVALPLLPVTIPPGGVEPKSNIVSGFHSFDAEGYSALLPTKFDFGVVFPGSHDALYTFETPGDSDLQTVFTIGDSGDTGHPVRGLQCEDAAPAPGTTGLLATCQLSSLPSIAVDTINVGLYGANAPFNEERRSAVYAALGGRSSDLMCVIETARDYAAIVEATKAHFPYSYFAKTDLDSQPTDPTDADGNTPPLPTAAPCAGIDPGILQSIYDCSAQQCSSTKDASGAIATTNCLSEACAGPFTQLYYQGPQQDACVNCIIYYANSELPLAEGQKGCASDARQPFSYEGMNSTLMLSRFPLSNTQAFILPGTGFRRAVLYAQVTLDDGNLVDFFCAQLVSPLVDGDIPYTGNYGTDVPGKENGWQDEQDLQAQKTVAWIQGTRTHPAIIAGDWHSTMPVSVTDAEGGTTVVLAPQSIEVMKMFDASLNGAFQRAEPDDYAPACESCPAPQNVYNAGSGSLPEDFTPTFLQGFPTSPNPTVEDVLWGMEDSVTLTSIPYEPAPAASGPISPYWGRLVRVLRPPKQ